MTTALLEARDLAVRYGNITGLQDVSFDLHEGGLALVLGPNGAGKSSLVTALAGVTKLANGSVTLDGSEVSQVPAFRRVERGLALVPEGRGTLRGLSVEDNLYLGWRAAPKERRGKLSAALNETFELFPRLKERRRQDCSTLSGGEMQMLAIGRALLARPKVLMLDEPSLGLAPLAIQTVYGALGQLSRDGLTMILVEQKVVPLDVVPERTIVLARGRITWHAEDRRPTDQELVELYLGNGVTV